MITEVPLTRCAFVVCRFHLGERTQMLLVHDERWGDFTFVGGHQESADGDDPEKTARREAIEELGCETTDFRLIPLDKAIEFGPIWSKSAKIFKRYEFIFFGIEFDKPPNISSGPNAAGITIRLFDESELRTYSMLSNIVKVFLQHFGDNLDLVPVSWDYRAAVKPSIFDDGQRALHSLRPSR